MNRLIGRLREALESYQQQQINLQQLHSTVATVGSALEGDVPADIRQAIVKADDDLELVEYTVPAEEQRQHALKVVHGLAQLLEQGE